MVAVYPNLIVGIGGSAGALNAYKALLDALPTMRFGYTATMATPAGDLDFSALYCHTYCNGDFLSKILQVLVL